mmetsp:Transcript_9021/g.6795  ORF Transcript_9021/g.6795 Transcript_9021/m.6795 type:complete len:505 (+) Transcript_9021:1275-2789(+)
MEGFMMGAWTYEKAALPRDLDWKNLAYDANHRCSRQMGVNLFIMIVSMIIVMPVSFLEQYVPMLGTNEASYTTEGGVYVEEGNGNIALAFMAIYLCPILTFLINFLLIPYLVIRLCFFENNHKFSDREFSIMNKNYVYMVFGSVILPGLQYTSTFKFTQLLVFPGLHAAFPGLSAYLGDDSTTCTLTAVFNVFYAINFFVMYMVAAIFLDQSIHIFALLPQRLAKYIGGGMFEFMRVQKNKLTKAYSGKLRFSDWYYSFDYQVSYVTSLFTCVLVFSTSVPIIIPFGLIFFVIKFSQDFTQLVSLSKYYFAADLRQSSHIVRSTILIYTFSGVAVYLLVNALIYCSADASFVLFYWELGLFLIWFILCVFFWVRWELTRATKVGVKQNQEELEHNNCFNMSTLWELYRHPLEVNNPSPPPRKKGRFMERNDSNEGFPQNFSERDSQGKFNMSEVDLNDYTNSEGGNEAASEKKFGHLSAEMQKRQNARDTVNSGINDSVVAAGN